MHFGPGLQFLKERIWIVMLGGNEGAMPKSENRRRYESRALDTQKSHFRVNPTSGSHSGPPAPLVNKLRPLSSPADSVR